MNNNRILVIGDGCIDRFIYGDSLRLCPDAPVPIFTPTDSVQNGGMAQNVKANISALGIKCDILKQSEDVIKTRYVDKKTNHTFLRVDSGENKINRISKIDSRFLNKYSAIAISDYNKGFLLEEDIQFICENHPLVFIDTKKHIGNYCACAKFIKINEIEYNVSRHALQSSKYNDNLIVTLGSRGCKYKDQVFNVDSVEVKDMCGAGDTFMAGLIVKYINTQNIIESIKFANKCATSVVQKRGVAVVDLQ